MTAQFTPTARPQFLSALAYIRQDNPPAAIRFRKKAESVLRRLEKFPDSGRAIPEFPEFPYREVIVVPYRFFYRVEVLPLQIFDNGYLKRLLVRIILDYHRDVLESRLFRGTQPSLVVNVNHGFEYQPTFVF